MDSAIYSGLIQSCGFVHPRVCKNTMHGGRGREAPVNIDNAPLLTFHHTPLSDLFTSIVFFTTQLLFYIARHGYNSISYVTLIYVHRSSRFSAFHEVTVIQAITQTISWSNRPCSNLTAVHSLIDLLQVFTSTVLAGLQVWWDIHNTQSVQAHPANM